MQLTNELLSAALSGLEYQKREIEAKIAEAREELKVSDFSRNTTNDMLAHLGNNVRVLRKRTMSASGRARIAAAQKKRWAAIRKANKGKKAA